MEEIHKLRAQITNIVQSNFPEIKGNMSATLPPPSTRQVCNWLDHQCTFLRLYVWKYFAFAQLKILRQYLTAGFIDCVAVRKDLVSKSPDGTKFASSRGIPYSALDVDEDVFIHPSSVLFHKSPPNYVIYQEVVRSSRVWIKSKSSVHFL